MSGVGPTAFLLPSSFLFPSPCPIWSTPPPPTPLRLYSAAGRLLSSSTTPPPPLLLPNLHLLFPPLFYPRVGRGLASAWCQPRARAPPTGAGAERPPAASCAWIRGWSRRRSRARVEVGGGRAAGPRPPAVLMRRQIPVAVAGCGAPTAPNGPQRGHRPLFSGAPLPRLQ
jgi:hypothetical protein